MMATFFQSYLLLFCLESNRLFPQDQKSLPAIFTGRLLNKTAPLRSGAYFSAD
ncbi:hypothetical protein BAMY6639_13350 [Bacillus amyloliquefaciens UMAF6639]|nr:hypothetical protein BAMY6639_13350 [Bacillus amyloliquefaciens UMAF6639]